MKLKRSPNMPFPRRVDEQSGMQAPDRRPSKPKGQKVTFMEPTIASKKGKKAKQNRKLNPIIDGDDGGPGVA